MLEGEGFVDISFVLHCAVYALLQRGTVVYIGQSKKPLTRIYSHVNARGKLEPWKAGSNNRKVGFKFDGIQIRPCMLRELDEIEAKMIAKYLPKYNTKGMPKVPADISLDTLIAELIPCLPTAPEPRQNASWRRW